MQVNDGCCPGDAAPSAPLRQPPHDQDDNSRDSRERGYVRSQRQNGRSRPNGRGTRSYFREAATDQYHGIAERAEKRLVVKPPIAGVYSFASPSNGILRLLSLSLDHFLQQSTKIHVLSCCVLETARNIHLADSSMPRYDGCFHCSRNAAQK